MEEEAIEAEKQIMLWERKIHLEREMQQALDPSVGELETSAMKKEIHRMQLRLEQLKRRQEQIIVEMERAERVGEGGAQARHAARALTSPRSRR